jgi:hypothetical protein
MLPYCIHLAPEIFHSLCVLRIQCQDTLKGKSAVKLHPRRTCTRDRKNRKMNVGTGNAQPVMRTMRRKIILAAGGRMLQSVYV